MVQTVSEKTDTTLPQWQLSDLYESISDPKIEQDLQTAQKLATTFSQTYKGQLNSLDALALKNAYQTLESLLTPLYKISQFISLTFATDTSNEAVKALMAKVDEVQTDISNIVLFFELEISQFSQQKAQSLLEDPNLEPYTYDIKRTIETASFNLTEKEEQVINKKDLTGTDGWTQYYEELTSDFEFEFELDGKKQIMNGSQLRDLRQHPDATVRRQAMALFLSRYETHQLTFTHIYNNVIKDYNIEKQLRGYSSAISRRNIGNDLPDNVVQTLHDVTTSSYPLVHRYYKLKKKLQNMPDMTLADIYAPLPESARVYSFDEAKQIVLDGFYAFDTDFGDKAKMMFDEQRIDAPVSAKKRGGAFCSGSTPDVKPYVLLNFLGKQRDVSTMAHELGHAIHDLYAAKQVLSNYHPILPLAETASVFSEMLITDKLKSEETDKKSLIALLTDKIEDIFATSHRQNMFSQFEIATHDKISKSIMSATALCDTYEAGLKQMFGDSVAIPAEYRWEWATIPHIYEYPFYVYAYNFGNLLVMALYQQYKRVGAEMIPKIKQVLSAGSCMSPLKITQLIDVDIADPHFWQQSIDYIETLLTELEGLVVDQ